MTMIIKQLNTQLLYITMVLNFFLNSGFTLVAYYLRSGHICR
jgi:hypothetical protein